MRRSWEKVVTAAEDYNDPGRFTTLIGFEWTSLVNGNNLHRNVVFRDGADKVKQVVPFTTQAPIGSTDPLDLYRWLENYEAKTGGTALALAHNGNLSNGLMFPVDAQYTGRKLDEAYVKSRARWEPMYEVTQMKGDGEAHPFLSPDDEFADYETWDAGNLDLSEAKKPDMLAREYAREALKNGLLLEAKLGTNPYKFGMVGSTDSHTGLSTAEEDNFFGKHPGGEPSPTRMEHPFKKTEVGTFEGWQTVASGMAAVWATENTREAIFDAMQRREVYATTGPRISVRFFGGWDLTPDDLNSRQPAFRGYEKGVPMGADLPPRRANGCAEIHGVRAARFDRGESGSHPDHQRLARSGREDPRARLRCGLVGRSKDRGERQASAGRQYGRCEECHVDEHHRCVRAGHGVDRSRIRCQRARVLLRSGDGDPDTAVGCLRCLPLRHRPAGGREADRPGTCLHVADLVHAVRHFLPVRCSTGYSKAKGIDR